MSHQQADSTFVKGIHKMMKDKGVLDYIIFIGGYEKTVYFKENRLLHLKCNDHYEGIPEKINKMFSFIAKDKRFAKYSHFLKLDQDIKLLESIEYKKIASYHYAGVVNWTGVKRDYHIGRCTPGTYFNNRPYEGPFVPYCYGGLTYLVSRKAAEIISADYHNYESEIYEDLYVAKILRTEKIFPTDISSLLKRHIRTEEHEYLFNSLPERVLRRAYYLGKKLLSL